jgi:nitrate/nitrite-specific signal transduction histidine kinase
MASNLEYSNALLKKHSEDLEIRVKERTKELVLKNKELAALYAVASSVSSTNQVTDVLTDVLKEIIALFGVQVSNIYLKKELGGQSVHWVWRIEYPEDEKSAYTEYIAEYSLNSMNTGQNIIIHDLDEDNPNFAIKQPSKLKSLISVPILHKNDILGAITLASRIPNRFSMQELTMLQAICNQLGVVITNVALFNEINEEHNTFLAVMKSIHEGLILIDAQARIIYMNPVFTEMFYMEGIDLQREVYLKDLTKYHHSDITITVPMESYFLRTYWFG